VRFAYEAEFLEFAEVVAQGRGLVLAGHMLGKGFGADGGAIADEVAYELEENFLLLFVKSSQ